MIAVDTNVLVRLLTGDDPKQATAARALFAAEPIWIAKTVLLETGGVLRSLYGFEESAVREAFTKLLGLENVHVENESGVASALALRPPGAFWSLSIRPWSGGRGAGTTGVSAVSGKD